MEFDEEKWNFHENKLNLTENVVFFGKLMIFKKFGHFEYEIEFFPRKLHTLPQEKVEIK